MRIEMEDIVGRTGRCVQINCGVWRSTIRHRFHFHRIYLSCGERHIACMRLVTQEIWVNGKHGLRDHSEQKQIKEIFLGRTQSISKQLSLLKPL